jgi:hypothetical protein
VEYHCIITKTVEDLTLHLPAKAIHTFTPINTHPSAEICSHVLGPDIPKNPASKRHAYALCPDKKMKKNPKMYIHTLYLYRIYVQSFCP